LIFIILEAKNYHFFSSMSINHGSKETLDSPQTRIRLGESVETVRQCAIAYGFCLAQGGYKQANQADVRLAYLF